jgi:hypothetical protein
MSLGLLSSLALAATGLIPVQGALVDAGGAPVSGTHTVHVTLWHDDAATTPAWEADQTVAFADGAFATNLSVDLSLFSLHPDLSLSLRLDGGADSGRVPVGWAPRAAWAADAGTLGGELPAAFARSTDSRLTNAIQSGAVAGGDLAGTLPSPSVIALRGRPIANTAPSANQVLAWNGSAWAPANDAATDASKLPLTGGALSGALSMGANAITELAEPSAASDAATRGYVDTRLAGRTLSSAAPSSGQVLTWGGSAWAPADPTGGGASDALVNLVDAASIAVNGAAGRTFGATLGGNRAFANPTALASGGNYTFIVRQDAVGGRLTSWGSAYKFPGTSAQVVTMIPANTGTLITNYNVRPTTVFDGNYLQNDSTGGYYSNAGDGFTGKDWGTPRRIGRVRAWGFSDYGFQNPSNGNVTMFIEGSNDNVSWTTLYSTGSITDRGGIVLDVSSLEGLDTSTAWRYHRLRTKSMGSDGSDRTAELEFYEASSFGTTPSSLQMATRVPLNAGTIIGNFAGGAAPTKAFDGVYSENENNGAKNSGSAEGYLGKSWGMPRRITRVVAYGFQEYGFQNPANGRARVTLQGSNDGVTWTNLYTSGAIIDTPGIILDIHEATGLDTSAAWSQHRVRIESLGSNGDDRLAELEFWEDASVLPNARAVYRFVADGSDLLFQGRAVIP